MAPKRANRSDQNNTVSTTDISNTRTTEQERQWDGQPYQKVSWYMLNLRALFQEIPEARQYIESGVLVGSKTVTVYSLAHVQTYVNGDYERGTLKSPFDFSTLPDECTPISKPVAAAESPEGEEGAQPSTPPSTEFIPTTLADLDVDTKRFVVAPEVIIQFEDQILRHWTNKILDDYLQREILAEHNHRGTALIRAMEKEMVSTDPDKNSASTIRQVEVRLHREAGISSTTVLAFNNFINRDADLNATLTGTARHEDDDMRALALREVLSAHSETVFTRIVVEENRIKTNGLVTSTKISELRCLVTAARNVFSQEETKAMRLQMQEGNLLKFRETDPTRDAPNPGGRNGDKNKNKNKKKGGKDTPYQKPTRWEEGMRACRNCKDNPINGGKHLDSDCPTIKGGVKLSQAADDTEAALNLFTGDGNSLSVSLDSLSTPADLLASIAAQGPGRVAMMEGAEPTPENLAWTLACDESDGGGSAGAQPTKFEARRFYVLPHGDPTGGIFYGRLDGEVLPVLQAHFTGKPRSELVAQLLTCATVADAVAACQERRAPTIFHGPAVLTGTQPGDDLGDETDDDDDDDASVTTESTTNASVRAPTQLLQAAQAAPSTAQAPQATAQGQRTDTRHIYVCTLTGGAGVYYSGLDTETSRMAHIHASIRKDVILGGGDSPTDDVLRMHTFLVRYNATDDGASHLSSEYGMKMRIISAAAALTHIGVEDLPVMPPSSFGGKIDEILGNATVRYCGPDAVAAGKGGDIYTPGRLIKFKDTPLRHLLCRVQPISLHGNRLEPKAAPPSNTLQWLQQHDLDGSATSGDSSITDDQRARMTTQQAAALQIQKQREQTTNTTAKSDDAADRDARTALVAEQKANVDRIAKMQDQLNDLMNKMPSITSTHDELRQQRELERERFAQERDERQQRERLRGFTKFAGFAALQMIILVIAFASHKYFTKAGAALPLACITAISAPMVHATCVFFLTVVATIRRQANSSRRPWLSVRSQDRARCKSNLSLYHLLVDGGPTWVKVAYVILRFFRVIPFKCITISAVALYSTSRTVYVESSRTIRKLPRRARSYLLGQVPAGLYRTFTYDLRQVLTFAAELHALLSLNWPVILARRLATGTIRARHACFRAINATLHVAIILHHLLSLDWPMITWRRLSNSLHWVQRYGRTATYFLLAPTSWTQGATLADAPSILYGLIQLVMVISTSKPEAADSLTPSISTAHEIRSPSPEDYYYSGHAERLLHVWNPRRLATKPPRTQKSIYAASADHQNYGRVLNFRARAPRQRGTISAKPDMASSLMAHASLRWINSVIDSGCSWHVHHRREDVINIRPCRDTFRGVDNKLHRATCMGDLPAVVKNSNGKHVKILIRNVRVVPTLNDTLFSVDQFWEDSRVDTMFRDVRCVILPPTDKDPTRVMLPFVRRDKLFKWSILPIASVVATAARAPHDFKHLPTETARTLKTATIHAPSSHSHVASLPPNQMIDALHRRLHIGHDTLRKLGDITADIPANIRAGKGHSCAHCKTANATHLSHRGSAYKPSYPGRLVHADIAGPFRRSVHGQHQYFLILIDDHTRWKEVYFLHTKDEALARIRSFVAKFKSVANQGRSEPTRIVGTLHTDNAGEFLSRQFEELLADETMEHTRCPAHVHQLNGVAERSIRSVLELVRSNLEASKAPVGFWPYIVEHAVDCLNRTTGPPGTDKTAYEMLTSSKPKVMAILPFGCRAYAVKPRAAFTKTDFESRAWTGVNLGRARHTPGAYNIWVPDAGKTVCTSEVYFDEGVMPWRPKGDQRVGDSMPTPPPTAVAVDALDESAPPDAEPSGVPPPVSAAEAYDRATRGEIATARRSQKVLVLFSGPYRRPDGLAAFLTRFGFDPVLLDNDPETGGGADGDILNDDVHNRLLQRVSRGEFLAVVAAPPCSTFSVTRHFAAGGSKDDGPPVVRDRANIRGIPNVPAKHLRELRQANAIVARMTALLTAAFAAGTQYIIENPADRGDPAHPRRFLEADHGPLWQMPEIRSLQSLSAKLATFPMCAFNAPWQKYTTVMYSSGFDEWLDPLDRLTCTHTKHSRVAGGVVGEGGISSSETSAYPTDFNHYLARAILSLARPTPTRTVANHDVREHAPDGGTTMDPAFVPPLLPPPPRAAAEAPATVHEQMFDGRENEGPDEPGPPPTPAGSRDVRETVTPRTGAPTSQAPKLPYARGAGPQMTRRARQHLGSSLAPGLGDSHGWAVAPLQMLQQAAGRIALSVTGGDGFAAFRDFDDDDCQDTPLQDILDECSDGHEGYIALAKPGDDDPKTQAEAYAKDRDGWRASEQKEIENHIRNGSWELVERSSVPRKRALIKLIWVYKVKRDGSLKSRLCVQGCRQVQGVDYHQTWCGTMRGTSLRLLSAVAAKSNMRMRRWDFVAAYLQGELLEGEVVYCLPPPGEGYATIGKDGLPMVCKIVKPVYGMAQAGRRWQRTLYPWLEEYGFTQLSPDSSVFTLKRTMNAPSGKREETLHLGAYVDDLCVLYEHDDKYSLYHDFTTKLQERWKVEDEGDLHDLLGIEFRFGSDTITLHQQTYIEKLSADFLPDGVPPQFQANKPPCDHGLPLHVVEAMSQEADAEVDTELLRRYQSLVGALLYCSGNTRPDVAFAVGMLCRAMSKPTKDLFQDGLRVLSYLHRTRHIGLRYESNAKFLEGQSDSDWGVRHSTSGWQFTYSQAVISWGSKKQTSVALSSCEAEIMAASEAAKEALFLTRFLNELGHGSSKPVELGMDNQAAIAISYNPELHSRTKHIDRRHFFIRECVENMQLRVPYVRTVDNLADFFTKPLAKNDYFRMRDALMNVPTPDCVPVSRDRATLVRGGV